ncbi:YdgA family protein [Thalassolituus pacificus]|uniref:YdgA family protein n=1 Tax=Thalassolituus pacificus TaxID=2975440 RepID=A0A9X2WGA8_9GAMM|nr:YdgA family protein [Thalassolituus pacificus]MCT7359738.1 YdgA family protein [Thalassolituus pacificus]
MGKTLALIIGLPVIAIGAAAGYVTYQNVERYDALSQQSLQQLNQALMPQGISVRLEEVERGFLGANREELYHFRLLGEEPTDLFSIRQHVSIEPYRASGTFVVDSQLGLAGVLLQQLPELAAGQQGEWWLKGNEERIYARYQTGAVNMPLPDGSTLSVAPLILQTETATDAAAKGKATLSMASASLTGSAQGDARLNRFELDIASHLRNGSPFIDKASYRIGDLSVSSPQLKVKLQGLVSEQAALVDRGVLASLTTLKVSNLRVSSADKDLSVDTSRLSLYLDGINWQAYQQLLVNAQNSTDEAAATSELLKGAGNVLASGASVTLETLETAFIFNDLSPAGMGASGDIKLHGKVIMAAGDAASLQQDFRTRLNGELQVNLSRSLMQSPLAEHFVSLLDAGMLEDQDGRLTSRLILNQGELSANGISVGF